ncbi:MAG: hypothetical protein CM15mP122_1800 [Bacteroidota bacterium]|nr:MAG: hypothetical protein CM15mP122_1800 [Bacteroidota bacterium]
MVFSDFYQVLIWEGQLCNNSHNTCITRTWPVFPIKSSTFMVIILSKSLIIY